MTITSIPLTQQKYLAQTDFSLLSKVVELGLCPAVYRVAHHINSIVYVNAVGISVIDSEREAEYLGISSIEFCEIALLASLHELLHEPLFKIEAKEYE